MNIPKYIELYRNELTRKGYRSNSIKSYCNDIGVFLGYFENLGKTEPIKISEQDIKDFLIQYKEHNTQRAKHSAIKCFYRYILRQPNKFKYIEYCKRNRRLPIVLSVEEVQRIIFCCSNLKHKTIICLMYSTGMRVGEVINLKICDIDSSRMVINIIDAKGGKDRQVTLDPIMLNLLRLYFKQYRPNEYLFNGQFSLQYTESSIRQFLQKYADIAGIKKRVYPHLIRHCNATHLLESGTDMSIIQKLLGHASIKTTQLYSHISNNLISSIKTPLQYIVNSQQLLTA